MGGARRGTSHLHVLGNLLDQMFDILSSQSSCEGSGIQETRYITMGMFTVLALAYFPGYAILCHYLGK